MMGLLDWFRSDPPIDTRDALLDFIDSRAAFLIQKNIFDYARARVGPYFKVIIHEEEFKELVEVSRWTSYPLGLASVAEMVYGALYERAPSHSALVEAISKATLEVFDRHAVPAALGETAWREAREALQLRLSRMVLHPPKLVKDILMPMAKAIFDALPIHLDMKKADFEMIRNQLRINLVTMSDDFERRGDYPALLAALGFRL